MEPIQIAPTSTTPTIKCDGTKGLFEIKGRSNPANSVEFYKSLYDYIDEYAKSPVALTDVHIQFEYFNTSTSKCILTAFQKFMAIYKAGHDVVINWYFEKGDEDMQEAGADFESIVRIPFKLIEVA